MIRVSLDGIIKNCHMMPHSEKPETEYDMEY